MMFQIPNKLLLKKISLFVFAFMLSIGLAAQSKQVLTLDSLWQKALENYPNIRQKDWAREINSMEYSNIRKQHFPQVQLIGQASYQSDVTALGITLPNVQIEKLSQDQYKVFLDINQPLFNGGITTQQLKLKKEEGIISDLQWEKEYYALKEKITGFYFQWHLANEQLKQIHLTQNTLTTILEQTKARQKNGVAMLTDVNELETERLNVEQKILNLEYNKKTLMKILSLFTQMALDDSTSLSVPVSMDSLSSKENIKRPEWLLFQEQQKQLSLQSTMVTSKNLPKLSLFAQSGMGRPALNFLNNNFDFYYIGGLRLSWSLSNLYTLHKEKRILQTTHNSIERQKENYQLYLQTQLVQKENELEKLESLIRNDKAIIELKESTQASYQTQLENGIITTTKYIQELNNLESARLALQLHQLQKIQTQIEFQLLLGTY